MFAVILIQTGSSTGYIYDEHNVLKYSYNLHFALFNAAAVDSRAATISQIID